jgi:hypothetical protein
MGIAAGIPAAFVAVTIVTGLDVFRPVAYARELSALVAELGDPTSRRQKFGDGIRVISCHISDLISR